MCWVYSFFGVECTPFFFLQTWTVVCVGLLRVYSLVIIIIIIIDNFCIGNICEELCEIVLYSQMRTCTAKGILSARDENLISQNLKF